MRSKFYKLSLVLLIISFLPFLIFLLRRENPPAQIEVPHHKTQTIENFELKASGRNRWKLKSPKATFIGKEIIKLKHPVLTIYVNGNMLIYAESAKLDKKRNKLILKKVYITGKNFNAFSKKGIYSLKKQIFETNSGCKAVYNNVNFSEGNACKIYLKSREIIITNGVKTVIREVLK